MLTNPGKADSAKLVELMAVHGGGYLGSYAARGATAPFTIRIRFRSG